jgi:hypothetical protein
MLLLEMVGAYKALLIYFGKHEAEAETDKDKCEDMLNVLVDFVTDVETEIRSHFSKPTEIKQDDNIAKGAGRIAPARLRRLKDCGAGGGIVHGETVHDVIGGRGKGLATPSLAPASAPHAAASRPVMHQQAALGASWLLQSLET